MSWFSSLSLRLFLGTVGGLGFTLLISRSILSSSTGATHPVFPPLMMILPMLLFLVLLFLVPNWILRVRWQDIWQPGSEGVKEVPPEKRRKFIESGLRELGSPWNLPPQARERIREFVTGWTRTLVRLRVRDEWAWRLYALGWYAIREDEDIVDELRALLMESRELEDDAFDVGLSVLDVRQADVDLAILLSHEGMIRESVHLNPERRVLLENAWLAAYARDEASRSELLPHLSKLFIGQQRRDEVSGRIYLDAFISGIRSPELRLEMRRVAAVLAKTGRSPEMTANLRALANSGNGVEPKAGSEVDTESILRTSPSWSEYKSAFPKDVDLSQELPKEKPKRKKEARKTAPAGKTIGDTVSTSKKRPQSGNQRNKRLWILIPLSILIVAVMVYLILSIPPEVNPGVALVPETQPVVKPKTDNIESELPYTVQVAALPQRQAAFRRIEDLRAAGVDAYYVITQRGDASWYRVRFGHYASTREANLVADSLKSLGVIEEYFVAGFEPGVVPPKR